MRRLLPAFGLGLLMAMGCARSAPPPLLANLPEERLVDLTHAFDEATIYWPTERDFVLEKRAEGVTGKGYFYAANRIETAEHGGTHVDAPYHFHAEGSTLDAIPLARLLGEGVVIDVEERCREDADYRVTRADVEAWERAHGPLPAGAILLLRTGFGRHWPDRARYLGTALRGEAGAAELHFPGLHPDAAAWLRDARDVKAVGIDTASIDHGPSTHFGSHVALFRGDIPVIENVARLERLPARGFSVIVLPMKIAGGSGGPARIVAILAPGGERTTP